MLAGHGGLEAMLLVGVGFIALATAYLLARAASWCLKVRSH